MKLDGKGLARAALLWLALGNLAGFALYYIQSTLVSTEIGVYAVHFSSKILETLLLLYGGLVLSFFMTRGGFSAMIPRALLFSLPRFLYALPIYYLAYANAAADWYLVLLTALGISCLEVLIYALLLSAFASAARLGAVLAKKGATLADLRESDPLATGSPAGRAVLFLSLAALLYNLVFELIDTVGYLVQYAGDYQTEEILYMIFSYLFLLLLFIGGYFAMFAVKKSITEKRLEA